jgi:hypothetical protein
MPGAFLYDNVVQGATLASAEASVGTLPLSNLQDAQPRRRTRLMGSAATIMIDLGSSKSVDCAALISTTLGAGATVRARVGPDAALVEADPSLALNFLSGALDPRISFTRASNAWYFNGAGNLVQASTNEPRFDYDPATLQARGLLIEGGSSNIALYSRDLTNAAWVKTNITAALNVTGINGAANSASRLTATAGNGTALQTITSASATHVSSFFAHRITGTGPVDITQDNGVTWTAITLTAAWQRFNVPAATVANPVIGFRLGTNGDVIAVDVAQCEVAGAPTSPIITNAASVARAADNATVNTLTPWFNPNEGTILVEYRRPFVGFNQFEVSFSNGTFDEFIGLYTDPVSQIAAIRQGAASQVALLLEVGAGVNDRLNKKILAYQVNNFATSLNGAAPIVDTLGSVPIGLTSMRIGTFLGGSQSCNGWISRLAYYPTRLSNAQLVALSGTGSSLVPGEVTGDTGTIAAEAEDANQGNVILTLPAPALGRYLRIDIDNPAAAYTDIGVLAAGALWRTIRSIAYGIEEGRLMLDRRDRNPFTGAEFPVPAIANPRYARFTLPVLSDAEVKASHRELVRVLGAAGDGLVIPDIADGLAERNRRALWGALNEPGGNSGTVMTAYNINERSFLVTERI